MKRLLAAGFCCACFGLGVGAGWAALCGGAAVALAQPGSGVGPDFRSIARTATPAVVNISAVQVVRTERSPFFADPFFRQFFGQGPFRVPQDERRTSLGSGVLVSSDGVIVTNNHVVQNARQIAVTLSDRRRLRGTLVAADPATDIAVVRLEASSGLPTLRWGDSGRAAVGEYVLAVGNPFQLNQTVTMGIISATGRSNVGIVDYEDFIQTDAAINPGNSGGALVNTRGELIGINTAIYSESGGYQGIGFAVPSNLAREVVGQILEYGRVRRGFTGITRIAELDARSAAALKLAPGAGVLVVELLRGSPADRAGLQPGDVVTSVEGNPVVEPSQLRNELARARVGSDLQLSVRRQDGGRADVRIHVEEATGGG